MNFVLSVLFVVSLLTTFIWLCAHIITWLLESSDTRALRTQNKRNPFARTEPTLAEIGGFIRAPKYLLSAICYLLLPCLFLTGCNANDKISLGVPQIITLALWMIILGRDANRHGKKIETVENAWATLISIVLNFALLYWGGYFTSL